MKALLITSLLVLSATASAKSLNPSEIMTEAHSGKEELKQAMVTTCKAVDSSSKRSQCKVLLAEAADALFNLGTLHGKAEVLKQSNSKKI